MSMHALLTEKLEQISKELSGVDIAVRLEHPEDVVNGDYATNVAFILSKHLNLTPMVVAEQVKEKLLHLELESVKKVSVANPGFVNILLDPTFFINDLSRVLTTVEVEKSSNFTEKRVMVEYAHPNTHKEMHIGHMRTLITGEALSRIFHAVGATVFRANYQGDIGPHVAKALYGIRKIMHDEGLSLDTVMSWSNTEKAHFLGRGYAKGSQEYEEKKEAIDNINMQLYANSPEIVDIYHMTRRWSLDYYQEFYSKFGTTFDKLFFESEMVESGREIVESNIGKVFEKDNGAIIFPGEKYGLHTRVFITQAGNPTYEGKEMGNAFAEHAAFPFELKVHVVGSEQSGYFNVVFKALELIDPEKFKEKQHHLSMGMVQLIGRKISSRTGEILRVDWLLEEVKKKVEEMMIDGKIEEKEKDEVVDQITVGAVKYSVLKVGATQDVAFDIERSVSLEGDSGPYLQYAFARTQSILSKAEQVDVASKAGMENIELQTEELHILRLLSRFDEVVNDAANKYSPNIICTYLYELASGYNLFYQKLPILKADQKQKLFRLQLTKGVGKRLKEGLELLGISAPARM